MNSLIPNEPRKKLNAGCTDFVTMAEHELSAFFKAVTELFGPRQAEISAEDWLHELTAIDGLPASTHEWRSITAKVLTRLASRVHGSSLPAVANI